MTKDKILNFTNDTYQTSIIRHANKIAILKEIKGKGPRLYIKVIKNKT